MNVKTLENYKINCKKKKKLKRISYFWRFKQFNIINTCNDLINK